jgi:hypothetical protein
MLPPFRPYEQLHLDSTSLPLACAGCDDDGVQDAKHPLHLLNDLDTIGESNVGDETETIECPTNTPCNSSGEQLLNMSLNNSDEQENSVTYSVLVDMPRDITYDNRDIYNCRQDKYLDLLVNHKTIDKVQTTAVGRSTERTDILLQAKPESSTTDQSTLPAQTSEETCSATSEDPEDYWNRHRWSEEEEEEEDIEEDNMDIEEGELWPSYLDYTPDISLGNNHQIMLQGNNSVLSTGFKFSCPIIPMIPCVPGDPTLLFYELRTNTLDPWGYDSVNTTTLRQHHSSDHIAQMQVPPVHIYGTTHHLSTSSTYEGFHDNHPLQD